MDSVIKRVLIVDDEQPIRTLLEYNLKQNQFETICAEDGEEALEIALKEKPDLILLDLMLPKMDGVTVCKTLRQQGIKIPIIMLTAKGEELDKVHGLEIGADDYMTKPFSPREVVARVKAVLRRSTDWSSEIEDEILTAGLLTVYPEKFEVYLDQAQLEFTPKEFELLVYFMQNKNRVLSREQLLSTVWNFAYIGDTRIVDVHVGHLREKIENDTKKPLFIKTVRGIGYKFEEQKH